MCNIQNEQWALIYINNNRDMKLFELFSIHNIYLFCKFACRIYTNFQKFSMR